MHLVTTGMIASGYEEAPGNLVLTRNAVYVLKNGEKPGMWTSLFGGVIGMALGQLIKRNMAADTPPGFLDDPELAGLSKGERRKLLTAQLLVRYDRRNPAFTAKPIATGFVFNDGETGARFNGWTSKSKIARYLEQHRIASSV